MHSTQYTLKQKTYIALCSTLLIVPHLSIPFVRKRENVKWWSARIYVSTGYIWKWNWSCDKRKWATSSVNVFRLIKVYIYFQTNRIDSAAHTRNAAHQHRLHKLNCCLNLSFALPIVLYDSTYHPCEHYMWTLNSKRYIADLYVILSTFNIYLLSSELANGIQKEITYLNIDLLTLRDRDTEPENTLRQTRKSIALRRVLYLLRYFTERIW